MEWSHALLGVVLRHDPPRAAGYHPLPHRSSTQSLSGGGGRRWVEWPHAGTHPCSPMSGMWCPSVTVCGADCNGAAAAAGGARLTDGWPARLSRFWYLRYGFSPLLNRDRLATLVTLLGSLPSPSFCAHTPPPHQHAAVRDMR